MQRIQIEQTRSFPSFAPEAANTVEQATFDQNLLAKKLQIAMGMTIEEYGVGNLAAAAGLLYDSVTAPQDVVQARRIPASKEFADRLSVLSTPLTTLDEGRLPDRDGFRRLFVAAMTSPELHKKSLYPGALEAARAMMEHGPMAIWTHGDTHGQPAREIFGLLQPAVPGSFEQPKKVVHGGFMAVRREVARRAMAAGGLEAAGWGLTRRTNDTMRVVASENKFDPRQVERLAGYFHGQGVSEVMIIEDRVQHIEDLQKLLAAKGITARGIWLRQGWHAQQDRKYDHATITQADSITAAAKAVCMSNENTGTICDFDGVLSDYDKRKYLHAQAVTQLFYGEGWLRPVGNGGG